MRYLLVRYLVIEAGSMVALIGGFLSAAQVTPPQVAVPGVFIGLSGLITASAPIYLAWMENRRSAAKQVETNFEISKRLAIAEEKAKALQDEVTILTRSVEFNRGLVAKYQDNVVDKLIECAKFGCKGETNG